MNEYSFITCLQSDGGAVKQKLSEFDAPAARVSPGSKAQVTLIKGGWTFSMEMACGYRGITIAEAMDGRKRAIIS
jgi:hypothetical protein